MDTRVSDAPLHGFRIPKKTLGSLNADVAGSVIAAASDIALIIDSDGVIRDLAFSNSDLFDHTKDTWIDLPWIDTVTTESRPKVQQILDDANSKAPTRWRHVNHPTSEGADFPVRYSALQVANKGNILAFGRELRSMSVLQQTLVNAQQSMEREYARFRQAETRYRQMFELATEAVLIIHAKTLKIIEANPASAILLKKSVNKIIGHGLLKMFDTESAQSIQKMLSGVETNGQAQDIQVHSLENDNDYKVRASFIRNEQAAFFLVHLSTTQVNGATPNFNKETSSLIKIVERTPEGFVITDLKGQILMANPAFLNLSQLTNLEQAKGELLNRWLGRPGLEIDALMKNLTEHGSIRLFSTIIRGEYGSTTDVEVSAVSVPNGDMGCFGFMIRNVHGRIQVEAKSSQSISPSVEQLTKLVGQVPLRELVRETTSVIERLSIEAALELTGDNRASAAEILGLSRQSLYSKLHRYGIVDPNSTQNN